MPRPKKPLEFDEGPQAFEKFRRLAQRLVQPRRDVLHSDTEETTIEETSETLDVVSRKGRTRKK